VVDHEKNISLCITGATGYVGRHLTAHLAATGQRALLIGRPGAEQPLASGCVAASPWQNAGDLAGQLSGLDRPVLLNLAGYFVKEHRADQVEEIVAGNLTYPTMILEAWVRAGHSRVVNVGTSWEFSDDGEEVPLNFYAAIKQANARLLQWYATRHPLQAINLKLNDTYGGDDRRAKLMPMLKRHAATGELAELGYSEQRINLTYIDDVVSGLLHAAGVTEGIAPGQTRTAFLLGSETCTIGELVDFLQGGIAPGLKVRFHGASPSDQSLRGVWEDAPRLPGWQPMVGLVAGLTEYFGREGAE